MSPTLLDLPILGRRFALDAEGLCVTLGAIVGLTLALRLRARARLPMVELRDLGLELVLVGVVGARILYLLMHLRASARGCAAIAHGDGSLSACLQPLWLWEGGLSFTGGLLVGTAWLLWRAPHRGLPPLPVADRLVPGLALAQAVADLGTFLVGSAYGAPTASALGVRFSTGSVAYESMLAHGLLPIGVEHTPPLHPVQLYAALGHLVILGALLVFGRAPRRPGASFAAYLGGEALLRLALDPLRAASERTFVTGALSLDQLVAMGLLAAAIFVAQRRER